MKITFYPSETSVEASEEMTVLEAARLAGLKPDSPCGGRGSCGKCTVTIGGKTALACRTPVSDGMRVYMDAQSGPSVVLREGLAFQNAVHTVADDPRYLMAIDIGTTTLACRLLDGKTGEELDSAGMLNPQCSYGGDVVTRLHAAQEGKSRELTDSVRQGLCSLIQTVCQGSRISPCEIDVVSVVGNTCMQQMFMGIPTQNLTTPPFTPELKEAELRRASDYLPVLENARLLVVPDIGGYLGADTVAGILASGLYRRESLTLLVDIGTNGEMVLGNKENMVACATAAGPALEGAKISCGMRGAKGAIDHVWAKDGTISYSVIGGGDAKGICGSGLIDLLAVLKREKLADRRGKLASPEQRPDYAQYLMRNGNRRWITLAPGVSVSQEDIRELQLAKGAIAAGIELMMAECGVRTEDIREVYLAGAFGSFIRKESACNIGLLPPTLLDRIQTAGNAALSGAAMIACSRDDFRLTEELIRRTRSLELAVLPAFSKSFSKNMYL